MKGQSSLEALILISFIIAVSTGVVFLGTMTNESAVIMRAVSDGAENSISAIDLNYGSSMDVESVSMKSSDNVTVQILVRNNPTVGDNWEYFRDNIVTEQVRASALSYLNNALLGVFPATVEPVKTGNRSYDVNVVVRRVTR